MSLDTGRYQLYSSLKALRERWDDLQARWDDVVRQEFAEDFWDGMETRTKNALNAIDQLAQVLNKAKQECR
jgi:hypothetical protein